MEAPPGIGLGKLLGIIVLGAGEIRASLIPIVGHVVEDEVSCIHLAVQGGKRLVEDLHCLIIFVIDMGTVLGGEEGVDRAAAVGGVDDPDRFVRLGDPFIGEGGAPARAREGGLPDGQAELIGAAPAEGAVGKLPIQRIGHTFRGLFGAVARSDGESLPRPGKVGLTCLCAGVIIRVGVMIFVIIFGVGGGQEATVCHRVGLTCDEQKVQGRGMHHHAHGVLTEEFNVHGAAAVRIHGLAVGLDDQYVVILFLRAANEAGDLHRLHRADAAGEGPGILIGHVNGGDHTVRIGFGIGIFRDVLDRHGICGIADVTPHAAAILAYPVLGAFTGVFAAGRAFSIVPTGAVGRGNRATTRAGAKRKECTKQQKNGKASFHFVVSPSFRRRAARFIPLLYYICLFAVNCKIGYFFSRKRAASRMLAALFVLSVGDRKLKIVIHAAVGDGKGYLFKALVARLQHVAIPREAVGVHARFHSLRQIEDIGELREYHAFVVGLAACRLLFVQLDGGADGAVALLGHKDGGDLLLALLVGETVGGVGVEHIEDTQGVLGAVLAQLVVAAHIVVGVGVYLVGGGGHIVAHLLTEGLGGAVLFKEVGLHVGVGLLGGLARPSFGEVGYDVDVCKDALLHAADVVVRGARTRHLDLTHRVDAVILVGADGHQAAELQLLRHTVVVVLDVVHKARVDLGVHPPYPSSLTA